ncbi:MAG: alpha/beta hydrolase [Alphaproteobacteria bacterium]|nr:MAG: alpha/beta hydrolase [Alphaproteobacteria bacterium]
MIRMKIWVMALLVMAGTVQAQEFKAQDTLLSGYDYPFAVNYIDVRTQGQTLKMAYMDVRPATPNGKVALLMHGKNFGGYAWTDTIKALTLEGYRVIVPDQIGFGKSDKPEHLQYSFQLLARTTDDLLRSLGVGKVDLVGHSMGGMLATRFALMYPQTVSKLVLVNPIGLEDWKTMLPTRDVDAWYEQELKQTPDSLRAYQTKAYYDGNWKPEYDTLLAPQAGWTLHAEYPRVAWNSALQYDMIWTQPVLYEFKNLTMPTLLIIGTRDRTALGKDLASGPLADKLGRYDRLGKMAARAIPGAKLVELPGVGHVPQIEAFENYRKALMGFLINR